MEWNQEVILGQIHKKHVYTLSNLSVKVFVLTVSIKALTPCSHVVSDVRKKEK